VQDSVLIPTKIVPPRVPDSVVRRARLNRRLEAHAGGSVLVSAPAGFGKTVLILDWVADSGRPCAWLSIDPFDNDPTRFFGHLAAAVARLDVPGAERAAALTRQLGGTGGRGALPPGLLEALSEIGRRAVIVLDDVHELESPGVLGPLESLLNAPSGGPTLVLLTRMDPSLGTARLRLAGQLLEIRERDLRVTNDEALELFDRLLPGGLDESLVKQLEQRTEGWVAGLRMAAIALQGAEDPGAVVASFTGSNRYVVEYLLEEAVDRQDPAVQRFLLDTSVLRRFRVDTCIAVTGDPECGARLSEVEAANLFLVPLGGDREWYRYHRLFAELLQFRLSRLYPDRLDDLHLRASEWFEGEGDVHAALEHASRVSDPRRLHELLDAHALELLARSEVATLRHWFGRLRDPLSLPYPCCWP
jgi:LuxR family transcriptional regulator, maltose regulon positive regulatory protein